MSFKEQGDTAYINKEYQNAIDLYTKAIEELRVPDYVLYSNRALCYLKLEKHYQALYDADKCIEINPDLTKGYIRKSHALLGIGRYKNAYGCLLKASKLDPKDNVIKTELEHLHKIVKLDERKADLKQDKKLITQPIISYDTQTYYKQNYDIVNQELLKNFKTHTELNACRNVLSKLDNEEWVKFWTSVASEAGRHQWASEAGRPLGLSASENKSILCIGTLFGLLPLTLAGNTIYANEEHSYVAQLTKDIYHYNTLKYWNAHYGYLLTKEDKISAYEKYTENFHLLHKNKLELDVIPDVIYFTMWDHTIFGNNILTFLNNINYKKCDVYPKNIKIYAVGIETKVNDKLQELRKYKLSFSPEVCDVAHTLLTTPKEVFDINLKYGVQREKTITQNWKFNETGTCDAIVFYYCLDGYRYPDMSIQYINPIDVKKGDVHNIEISHTATKIMFNMPENKNIKTNIVSDSYYNYVINNTIIDAYCNVIQMTKCSSVLVVGCGAGLLPMLISEIHPMSKIYGCETSKTLCEIAMRSFKLNKIKKDIKIFNTKMVTLKVPEVLPKKVDTIVFENIDSSLITDGIVGYVQLARHYLLEQNGRMIPCGANVKGILVELRTNDILGYDMQLVNTYRWSDTYQEVDMNKLKYKTLSSEFDIFHFNFYKDIVEDIEQCCDVEIKQEGTLTALLYWFDLHLDEKVSICSKDNGFKACLYFFPEMKMNKGQVFPLKAKHNGYVMKFGYDEPKLNGVVKTDVPRIDTDWFQSFRKTKNIFKEMIDVGLYDSEVYKNLAKDCIKMASDPGHYNVDSDLIREFTQSYFLA